MRSWWRGSGPDPAPPEAAVDPTALAGEETAPETNSVLAGWQRLGIIPANAADSQALLELKKNYCDPRKCLDCAVGQTMLGRSGA